MKTLAMASREKQRGAAAVEFALIATIFFGVLFGIVEFGRGLYVWNSVQEVTRYAAREAVVCWSDQWSGMIQNRGVMGMSSLLAAPELVATRDITIVPLRRYDSASTGWNPPTSVNDNISNCAKPDVAGSPQDCIGYVRVTVNASFTPLIGTVLWFTLPNIQLPPSTVVMPAESLGYQRDGCAI